MSGGFSVPKSNRVELPCCYCEAQEGSFFFLLNTVRYDWKSDNRWVETTTYRRPPTTFALGICQACIQIYRQQILNLEVDAQAECTQKIARWEAKKKENLRWRTVVLALAGMVELAVFIYAVRTNNGGVIFPGTLFALLIALFSFYFSRPDERSRTWVNFLENSSVSDFFEVCVNVLYSDGHRVYEQSETKYSLDFLYPPGESHTPCAVALATRDWLNAGRGVYLLAPVMSSKNVLVDLLPSEPQRLNERIFAGMVRNQTNGRLPLSLDAGYINLGKEAAKAYEHFSRVSHLWAPASNYTICERCSCANDWKSSECEECESR